jgi:hypothetical protein
VAAALPPIADLVPVLERAARYVLDYEQAFHDVAAEENYSQWAEQGGATMKGHTLSCTATSCRRLTRADVVFVRLGGEIPWGTFRDVFEVDGQKVRPGGWEAFGASSSKRRAWAGDPHESANIGPVMRSSLPTLALAFHPRNQHRFAWKRGGTRRFGTVEGLEVEFEEVATPTLVDQDGRGDLPARGRFWLDPERGTVLRSETRFLLATGWGRASIATEYRAEPRLAMWVPAEMREEYSFRGSAMATARYSNFRKFTVTVERDSDAASETGAPPGPWRGFRRPTRRAPARQLRP